MNASPRLVVAAALVAEGAEGSRCLLAARRSAPSRLAGGWELPGGKVEPGESPLEALHREIAEELGITIDVGELVPGPTACADLPTWPLGDPDPVTGIPTYCMAVWTAEVRTGVPQPLEDHDELRWLARDALDTVEWLPADLPIVRAIADLLG